MTEPWQRYDLRWLLLAAAACSLMLGGYLLFARAAREADRHAIRSAYVHRRLTREQAIENGLGANDPAFQKSSDRD